ncbi:MAG: type II secretion system protein [Mobilitalea sp.]
MKNWFKKLNNQGSTLLTVIICLAFIGILGAMMLSVTLTNLQMKIVESKSKKNFYSAEIAMEEIRVAIQEISAEAIKDIYENDVLGNTAYYLGLTDAQINLQIKEKVVLSIMTTLGVPLSPLPAAILDPAGIPLKDNYFISYLSDATNYKVITPPQATEKALFYDITTSSIRIKDIKIEYEENDYRTAIISDIIIKIPEFLFHATTYVEKTQYTLEQPFKTYVLVADGAIISKNTIETTKILGSVYAGDGGIQIDGLNQGNHQVYIYGKNIVTRGNITVSDTAKLTIDNTFAPIGSTIPPIIWANNLVTLTSNDYTTLGSTLPTNLIINGICIIKDDLVLDGIRSKVNMLGSYLGYTGTHNSDGSAMMINGSGSSLNLIGLTDLVLAGRAHVSVADIAAGKDSDILTGESIAFKSNQRAYLLPGKFITNILHNPITDSDYSPTNMPDIQIVDAGEPIPYNYYLLSSIKYKIAAKVTGATTLRYYYLNFGSGKLADKYLKDYQLLYPNTLDQMAPFTLGNVVLPGVGIGSVVGNSMSYDADGTKEVKLREGMSSDILYTDDATLDAHIANLALNDPMYNLTPLLMGNKVGSLNYLYSRINHLLTLDSTILYDDDLGVLAPVLIANGMDSIGIGVTLDPLTTIYTDFVKTETNDIITNTTDPSRKSFHIVKGNAEITAGSTFNGFLIAKGSITIGDNVTINGMIITTDATIGDITLGNNVKVNGRLVAARNIILGQKCTLEITDPIEAELAAMFTNEGNILKYLFNNAEMTVNYELNTPTSSLVDLSSMISYENWRKVE